MLDSVAVDVQTGGGSAFVLQIEEPDSTRFEPLFDRSTEYAALMQEVAAARANLNSETVTEVIKQARKFRKSFAGLVEIDFFPGEAQKQAAAALQELELASARVLAPDEPHAMDCAVPRLSLGDYQGRIWATRARPWVDRLASAWLIRRFIDPNAQILWLESPVACPADALGFDFDGATFTHIGARVSFEVLLASFGFEQVALKRLGALVHYLDVGGVQPAEAQGIETVLAGLRAAISDDDQLLATASGVFDGLLAAFQS